MQTIEHTMCLYLGVNGDMEKMKKYLPAFLLPDAIRMYTGPREYSHFEKSPDGNDVSHMVFPFNMKAMTRESVQELLHIDSHITEHGKCVIGEETSLETFSKYNAMLPHDMYHGIMMHLAQDRIFDTFIRDKIDCTERYSDKFVLANGVPVDGPTVRASIAKMESFLSHTLAEECYTRFGITANQEWFDQNIRPIIEEAYPEELAANTYKYMKFDPHVDIAITKHEWLDAEDESEGVSKSEYLDVVNEVVCFTDEYARVAPLAITFVDIPPKVEEPEDEPDTHDGIGYDD